MFLNDILIKDNFLKAAESLGQPFVEEMNLGKVHQLGLVVPDAQSAANRLEQKGIPPFFLANGPVDMWTENGKDREFRGSLGISSYQGKELELLEPGVGSNFYRQSLDPDGGVVIQHLGFIVKDVDESSERLTAAGCPLWVRGRIKIGPCLAEFAYMDAIAQCGFIVEFISYRLWNMPVRPRSGLYKILGQLQKVSGKRTFTLK